MQNPCSRQPPAKMKTITVSMIVSSGLVIKPASTHVFGQIWTFGVHVIPEWKEGKETSFSFLRNTKL